MLKFYCSNVENCDKPFVDNSEVLLSISMIAERDYTANKINFYPENQSNIGFLEMVNTLISNPKIEKVALFDTAYLQRHRKILELFSLSENNKDSAEHLAEKHALEDSIIWRSCDHHKRGMELLEKKYKNKFTILNWVDVLLNPDFRTQLSKVNNLYYSDASVEARKFRYAVNRLIDIFFRKLSNNIKDKIKKNELTIKFVRDQLTNIVLEESAARSLLNYQYEIYRGPANIPTTMVYKKFGFNGKMLPVSIGNDDEIKYCKKVNLTASSEINFEKRMSKLMDNQDSDLIDVQLFKFKVSEQGLNNLLESLDIMGDTKVNNSSKTNNICCKNIIKDSLAIKGKKSVHIISIYNDAE